MASEETAPPTREETAPPFRVDLEEWHPSPNERHLATAAQPLIIVYNCTDHAARADAYCRAEASVFLRGAISGSEPSEGSSSLELSSDLLSSEPEPVMNETLAQELRHGRGFLIGLGKAADWRRVHDDASGRHWWWQPSTGTRFWEHDPTWHKFRSESGRSWWEQEGTGVWFFEPRDPGNEAVELLLDNLFHVLT